MDYYIVSTCIELGLQQLLAMDFPTQEHAMFIESILKAKNTKVALENNAEATEDFEKNGLNDLIPAAVFFKKMQTICERGSYKSASIRMDMQISTRVTNNAPDCKLNMVLKTTDWEKTLNMSTETNKKLLEELQNARTFIRQSKAAALVEQQVE
uniref:COMM domain-containing protein n=1 Tax=Caenorhabditis tropicalis TaxID=1561998 RepID=A0A1I7TRV2_9PELO